MKLQENISLAQFTTFRLGGPARYFVEVKDEAELKEASEWAEDNNQPIFVIAGGSNLIVSSKGYDGLVIHLTTAKFTLDGQELIAEAGVPMSKLVDVSIGAGLKGLEWAGGLPGSFGGAIRGNAGCFGAEIKDNIKSVESFDTKTGEYHTYTNSECKFGYRDSVFKHNGEVILSAVLSLEPGDKDELAQIAESRKSYRSEKHPIELPCAGSIFKNIPVEKVPADVMPKFEHLIKTDPFPVIPVAAVIADAALQGTKIGGAELSSKHTNFIVNTGDATGEDVVKLIDQIESVVREKYRIEIEVEPELVGF
jgi:UDP-N-acetylmuramate dehydrogenase